LEETVEEEEQEVTMIPIDDTDEVTVEAGDATDLFIVGGGHRSKEKGPRRRS